MDFLFVDHYHTILPYITTLTPYHSPIFTTLNDHNCHILAMIQQGGSNDKKRRATMLSRDYQRFQKSQEL